MRRIPRRRFLPGGPEPLEGRALLSRPGIPAGPSLDAVEARAAQHLEQGLSAAEPPVLAVVGDDFSQEYQTSGGDQAHARGWVEQLAATGRASFGPWNPVDSGGPRGKGFTLNWARDGATSDDVLLNQLPGLLPQLATRQVDHVVLFMGASDFVRFLEHDAPTLLDRPNLLQSRLTDLRSHAELNLARAVDQIQDGVQGVGLLVATIPDPARLPAVAAPWEARGPQGRNILNAVSRAVRRYNNYIRFLLENQDRAAVVDVASRFQSLTRGTGTLRFGNSQVDLAAAGNDPLHFLLADGRHLGTVAQGLIANQMVAALNDHFRASVRPLGAPEILHVGQVAANRTIR